MLDSAEVGRIFREESGRSVATLIGAFGDIDLAEDAVQEAFAIALRTWPRDGVPPNPGGWITTTARNHALDRLRRESRGRQLLSDVAMLSPGNYDPGRSQQAGPLWDDRLRLIFTCCHPALSTEVSVRRGDPAGPDPGGAHARRARGDWSAGVVAADRVPSRVPAAA